MKSRNGTGDVNQIPLSLMNNATTESLFLRGRESGKQSRQEGEEEEVVGQGAYEAQHSSRRRSILYLGVITLSATAVVCAQRLVAKRSLAHSLLDNGTRGQSFSWEDNVTLKESSLQDALYKNIRSPSTPYNSKDFAKGSYHKYKYDDELWPKVALLMSFPNSGTSYTLLNTRSVSQKRTAGNYCDDGPIIQPSIYNQTEIPAPHYIKAFESYDQPDRYILTKTHCGGRCTSCKTNDYIIHELQEFEDECLRLCLGRLPDGKQLHDYYDISLVSKAIHLFRNPLDNLISRFHLHYNHAVNWQNEEDLQKHPKTIQGYQQYCADIDHEFRLWRHEIKDYGPKLWRMAKEVPCHADIYRYVQWHNLVFELVQKHNISTHILHYEDYHTDFNSTVQALLDFLEMPWVGDIHNFYWSDYSHYYSPSQKVAARKFIRAMSSNETWAQVRRYFPRGTNAKEP